MKILLLMSILILAGCGKNGNEASSGSQNSLGSSGQCARSPLIGRWESLNRGTILEFTGNCNYINAYCQSQGTFPSTEGLYPQGTVNITVDLKASTAPSGCLPVGRFACDYQIVTNQNPNMLQVTCAGVRGTYEKL